MFQNRGKYAHQGCCCCVKSDRTEMSRKEYKKQRNSGVNLLKRAKKEHLANLDINSISDNKNFWQIVKPFFSQVKLKLKKLSN